MRNKTSSKNRKQQGFTLIELLMVISIIGLLASMLTLSLTKARQKGRDAKRIADMHQLDTAIQLYIDDAGHAPYIGGTCPETAPNSKCMAGDRDWSGLTADLSDYVNKLPKDPCGSRCPVNTWFEYQYHPPAYEAYLCSTTNCGLSEGELAQSYAIYASALELQGPYGYSHGVADSF